MDKRKARRAGILLAILVVVPAVVLVVYLLTVARTPFTGDMHHDFGIVSVTGESTTVAYTYDLVNRTDEQLIILDVKPSCGCAAADVSTYLIDPGETLAVEAHLTLERSGLKEEAIALIMKGIG